MTHTESLIYERASLFKTMQMFLILNQNGPRRYQDVLISLLIQRVEMLQIVCTGHGIQLVRGFNSKFCCESGFLCFTYTIFLRRA